MLPFMLVQTRSLGVLQFRLLWTMSFGVAFYARADQERCATQFWLVQARSIWCRVAVSARAGEESRVLQFRLVRTRSFGSCSLGSCKQRALVRAV